MSEAGSCLECLKRTGHNTRLFSGTAANQPDPKCYAAKIDAHVRQIVAAKPKQVQMGTAYSEPAGGCPVIPRNMYVEIRHDKPKSKIERELPEYKTCKYTAEAIVIEGTEKGETKRVCANPECRSISRSGRISATTPPRRGHCAGYSTARSPHDDKRLQQALA